MSPWNAPERLVRLDTPEQRVVAGRSTLPLHARIDPTHELPVVVCDGTGHEIARFANPADVALFIVAMTGVSARLLTLPAPLVEAFTTAQQDRTGAADLPARLRKAGAQ